MEWVLTQNSNQLLKIKANNEYFEMVFKTQNSI